MPRGDGPRLVIDLGVELKRRFHGRLALEGRTAKSWVTERVERYVGVQQLPLALEEPSAAGSVGPTPLLREPQSEYGARRATAEPSVPKTAVGRSRAKRNRPAKTRRSRDS